MSIKEQFNEDEWYLLMSVPAMIGSATATAEGSGVLGTVKEMLASSRGMMEGKNDYPDNPLIQALVVKPGSRAEAKEIMEKYRDRATTRMQENEVNSKDELKLMVLEDCRAACALLERLDNETYGEEYKRWAYNIGEKVAAAAKEGGFFGIGGTKISEGEKILLSDVKDALGILEL